MKIGQLSMLAALLLGSAFNAAPAAARRGVDNPPGDVRQCRGCDDGLDHNVLDDRARDLMDQGLMNDNDVLDLAEAMQDRLENANRGRGQDDTRPHH